MPGKLSGALAWFTSGLTTKQRGDAAEDAALRHLQKHGLRLLARNFKVKGGEIDLVMQDGATLVFVEVRARSRSDYGDAAASVTKAKQRRITHAAALYLQQRGAPTPACRFDVLAIAPNAPPYWIKAAFDVT